MVPFIFFFTSAAELGFAWNGDVFECPSPRLRVMAGPVAACPLCYSGSLTF